MNRINRIYYYAVFGAIGGLFGWQTSNLLGLSFFSNIYLDELLVGALIGLCIGLFTGIAEGVLTRNIIRAARSGGISAALGVAAGAVGLPLGEFLFQSIGAGLAGRILGWGFFGMLIGLAEGLIGRSQVWKGVLGGLLGGALGGLLLQGSQQLLKNTLVGKAVGLVLMGGAIGAFISLIVVLLSRAWLEVKSGKLKGTEFILDKFMQTRGPAVTIGSSALKSEIVLPDPDIAPQHAMLTGDGAHFNLKDMSLSGTFVNKRRIERTQLADRNLIHLGNTDLVYHEKR